MIGSTLSDRTAISSEGISGTWPMQPGFFRITGKKYFVLYRSQAINISYSTSGSLVFPDHRQKIFRTLPITGKKYFVLYLRWLGEGNFLVQILCGGSVIGQPAEQVGQQGPITIR